MQIPKEIHCWQMMKPGSPLALAGMPVPQLRAGEVLIKVAACGLCHTDLGFMFGGVKTKMPPPLTLGHEISGEVVASGGGERADSLAGRKVVVPAVLPCGECDLCRKGRGNVCQKQLMPGNDFHGGFADYVVAPARFLCDVGDTGRFRIEELAVVADALTTPYQAIMKAGGIGKGDLAIFIGTGGIGGFGAQLAAAMGASVVAVDVDAEKLEKLKGFGASLCLDCGKLQQKEVRDTVRGFAKQTGLAPYGWKIFECSGTAAGQDLAFGLLTFAGSVSIVGFTMEKVQVRLSNLMAFDAAAIGNWGCLPEYYPDAVKMVLDGRVKVAPFIKEFRMSEINEVIDRSKKHEIKERPVLIPDF